MTCDATDPSAVHRLFAAVDRDLCSPEVASFNSGAFQSGGILEIGRVRAAAGHRRDCCRDAVAAA